MGPVVGTGLNRAENRPPRLLPIAHPPGHDPRNPPRAYSIEGDHAQIHTSAPRGGALGPTPPRGRSPLEADGPASALEPKTPEARALRYETTPKPKDLR